MSDLLLGLDFIWTFLQGTAIRDRIQEQIRTKNIRGLIYDKEDEDDYEEDDGYYYDGSTDDEYYDDEGEE